MPKMPRTLGSKKPRPNMPSAARRGYTYQWKKLRLQVLEEEPFCRMCGKPSEMVDHIVPLSKGGTHDRRNLQGACYACNNRKARAQKGERR